MSKEKIKFNGRFIDVVRCNLGCGVIFQFRIWRLEKIGIENLWEECLVKIFEHYKTWKKYIVENVIIKGGDMFEGHFGISMYFSGQIEHWPDFCNDCSKIQEEINEELGTIIDMELIPDFEEVCYEHFRTGETGPLKPDLKPVDIFNKLFRLIDIALIYSCEGKKEIELFLDFSDDCISKIKKATKSKCKIIKSTR